jgi:hypothetical protein
VVALALGAVSAIETPEREAGFERAGRKSRGSSLVEMLVAIFVLGIVLISMVGMFVISRAAIYNKEDETANAIALRYMEELEGRPFGDFSLTFSESRNFGKYGAKASVPLCDEYSATMRVEVEWDSIAFGGKKVEMERVISAGGYHNTGGRN